MKNNQIIIFFILIFVLIFSMRLNAELIFNENFPKKIQGTWSSSCESEIQIFIISENTSMWIDETYVGFNISKTSEVNNWTAYKWGELDGNYYYFLNILYH